MRLLNNRLYRIILILSLAFLTSYISFFLLRSNKVYAQCLQSNLNEGLISAVGTTSGNTGNISQICVTGTQEARYREFKVPTYDDLENQFYTLNRTNPPLTKGALPGGTLPTFTGSGLYTHTGDLNISSDPSGTGVIVIFVRGSLNIQTNITYANADPNSGLVFIVRDNINIYSNVTQINAVLINTGQGLGPTDTTGFICTSFITGSGCFNSTSPPAQQLVINGSLISLNKNALASGQTSIKLARDLLVNTVPAEVVNKQAKYLYLLRGGILTKDLIITTEDQRYDIPGVTFTPPVIPPLSTPTCAQAPFNPPPNNNTWTISNLIISGCFYQ